MIKGLERACQIVEKEIEFSKKMETPLMTMGMSQILMLLKKEIEDEELLNKDTE